jgi:hypothetical protein
MWGVNIVLQLDLGRGFGSAITDRPFSRHSIPVILRIANEDRQKFQIFLGQPMAGSLIHISSANGKFDDSKTDDKGIPGQPAVLLIISQKTTARYSWDKARHLRR